MGATPLTLRCPRCKVRREWDSRRDLYDKESHRNLVPTGKTKVIGTTSAKVHRVQAVQLKHDGPPAPHILATYCGHVFWSTHPDAVAKVFGKVRPRGNASCRYAEPIERGER